MNNCFLVTLTLFLNIKLLSPVDHINAQADQHERNNEPQRERFVQKNDAGKGGHDRGQERECGKTTDRIGVNQIEPQKIADKGHNDPLIPQGKKNQDIDLLKGCFTEQGA